MKGEEIFKYRKTVRQYLPDVVSDEDVEKILDAALAAPLAAGDDKTTHITVVKPGEIMEKIRAACQLTRKNGEKMDPLYGASTMFFVSSTDLSEDCIEFCNAGCVIENILLQATAVDLGSTYIWGCLKKLKKNPEAVALLNIPEGYEIMSAAVVGYPAEPLSERVGDRERITHNIIK